MDVGFLGQFGMREESEDAEPVVDGDDDDALLGEIFAVVSGRRAGSTRVSAAVNPDHHWTPLFSRRRGSPDVQVEAVLAHCAERLIKKRTFGIRCLDTNCREFLSLANTGPGGGRLRR